MKKLFYTLLALILAQGAFAQVLPGKDPIGTIYTFETKVTGLTMDVAMKLLASEADKFTVGVSQELPNNLGTLDFSSDYIIKDGMLVQPLSEIQKMMEEQVLKLSGMSVNISIEGEAIGIPLNGNVGDDFPLTEYTVITSAMGFSQKVDYKFTSNKITGTENITVPAGTFDTFIVEVTGDMKASAMGQTQNVKINSKYWVSPVRGVVKSVVDDGSGQITTQVLKSITLP